MTITALDPTNTTASAEVAAQPSWHLAAHVVFPTHAEPELLPLYVEYGTRAARIDDAHDRTQRGWGDYKGIQTTDHQDTADRIFDVTSRRSIKVRSGENLSTEEVKAFCQGQIAHYKIPRYVKVVDEFPMTVTGKIQKYKRRDESITLLGLEQAAAIDTA